MGGKTKTVSPKKLEKIYVTNRRFLMQVEESSAITAQQLAYFESSEVQSALSGGQGEVIKDGIRQVAAAQKALGETIEKVSKVINSRIEGAGVLAKDKHGFGDIADKAKSASQQMKLRK